MPLNTGTQATVGIIPARWASSRFPGKPLHEIAGKPLVQHVWERCSETSSLDAVIIATDDDRISEAALGFGAQVAMTSVEHCSGTDRIAEALESLEKPFDIVVNIQGDEPLVSPQLIDSLVQSLIDDTESAMATAASPISNGLLLDDPNVVKVVADGHGRAIYFSRSPIPYRRGRPSSGTCTPLRHHGIYAFRTEFLREFVEWPPAPLEEIECLEQLRALYNGARIHLVITEEESFGVDTPDQARQLEKLLNARQQSVSGS